MPTGVYPRTQYHRDVISSSMKGIVFSDEHRNNLSRSATTHGMRNTRFYRIWTGIKTRCKPTNRWYSRIKNEWMSFEDFKNDMYDDYLVHVSNFGEKNTTIDRIDSSGNYNKSNCRWATYSVQNRNRPRFDPHKPQNHNRSKAD